MKQKPCWLNQTRLNGGWTCGFKSKDCFFNHKIFMTEADFYATRIPGQVRNILSKGGAPIDFKRRSKENERASRGEKGGKRGEKGGGKGGRGKGTTNAAEIASLNAGMTLSFQRPTVPPTGDVVKEVCKRRLCSDETCLDTKDHSIMIKHLQTRPSAHGRFPISANCAAQTTAAHSSTEAEIVSLGAGTTHNPFDPMYISDANDFDIPNRDEECVVCNNDDERIG